MNVFILCTGRCGSVTFAKACEYIKNYSSGHETRTLHLAEERFNYPENHIEIDNRLSWLTGRLDQKYGDDAFYVHLRRDFEETALSYSKRKKGIMRAYHRDGILLNLEDGEADKLDIARDCCNTMNTNIELFLKDKTNKMNFNISESHESFPIFCEKIAAEVDLESALKEFGNRHNAWEHSDS